MNKRAFGELELSILKVIREGKRMTVRKVYEILDYPGSYTTIMTVMSRMAEKGELEREKDGKQYVYWASENKTAASKNLLGRIQDKLFGGKPTEMVSYLLEVNGKLSEENFQEIEKWIEKQRAEHKKNHE